MVRYALAMAGRGRPAKDRKLVQIVDAALAEAAVRSGAWLACRPGCTQCCIGVFAINQLDVLRLKDGMNHLKTVDPERAARVARRARQSVSRLAGNFPGEPRTGILDESEEGRLRFEEFANDEPCPALDPATGSCDVYEFRPMTCRVFGPPVRSDEGLAVCELCYQGATDKQIAACEMKPDPDNLEATILRELEQSRGRLGETIVAFCLAGERSS